MVRKIIVMTVCLIFFSLLMVSMTYYLNIRSIIEDEVESTYDMITEQYANNVSYRLNIYENLVAGISTSTTIQKALTLGNADYYSYIENDDKISETVDYMSTGYSYNDVLQKQIFVMNPDFAYRGKYTENILNVRETDWFGSMNLTNRKLQFASDGKQTGSLSFLKIMSSLQKENRLEILGLVKLDVDKARLFQLTDKRIERTSEPLVYVFDDGGHTMYANTDHVFAETGLTLSVLKTPGNEVLDNKGRIQGMAVIQDLNYRGWKAAVIFPLNTVNEKVRNAILLLIVSFISIGGISLVIILLFSRSFARRFGLLLRKMDKVKGGDLNIDFVMDSNDEIGIADRNFNEMVDKLRQSINENYLQMLGKREAELRALQFQINPHFLYNTLECVNSLAIVNDNDEISRIVLKLGEMLRYNLNNSQSEYVELQEEIQQIHNYVAIQEIRFGNRFNVIFDIPPEFDRYKILRFLLQPVIENSIEHGFSEKRDKGFAEVSVSEADGVLEIKIQDDGTGIPADRLAVINSKMKINQEWQVDGRKKSIGLQNVNSRIKLAYGDDYGIDIDSTLQVGTLVRIRIPKIV